MSQRRFSASFSIIYKDLTKILNFDNLRIKLSVKIRKNKNYILQNCNMNEIYIF